MANLNILMLHTSRGKKESSYFDGHALYANRRLLIREAILTTTAAT